jgi:signal peptidase I
VNDDAIPTAPPRTRHHHELMEMVQSLMSIIVIALFIMTFLVQPHRIPSASMEPALLVGDFVLVTKNGYTPQGITPLPHAPLRRGQTIVFLYPVEPDTHLVKRVIGLPGDHLHLSHGHVFINGQPLDEPYAVYRPIPGTLYRDNFPEYEHQDASILPEWVVVMHRNTVDGDLVVPPHEYFVLGDNRNDSLDSRYWGFVPEENIIGQPWLVYFSLRIDDNPNADFPNIPRYRGFLDWIAGVARWDRTLHLVQ